jgi:hypothetical protein
VLVLTIATMILALGLASAVGADPIGPDLRVSPIPGIQNEPDIAVFGNSAVAVWYRNPAGYNVGWGYSLDGGQTWADGGLLPGDLATTVGGFPTICVDNAGRFYAAAFLSRNEGCGLGVWRGSFQDPGFQWSAAVPAIPLEYPNSDLEEPEDAPYLTCDPVRGYLYLTYTHTLSKLSYTPSFVRSLDGGLTWSAPQTLGSSHCNGVRSAVGPDGELYVVWEDFGTSQMLGRKSTSFGANFGPPFVVATINDNLNMSPPAWFGPRRYNSMYPLLSTSPPDFPSIAVDRGAGPYRGRVYLTWAENAAGTVGPGTGSVTDVEPNDFFINATPVQIGQDIVHYVPDTHFHSSNFGWFTFTGTQGTTLWVRGEITGYGYSPLCAPLFGATLYCGDDTTRLVRFGSPIVMQPYSLGPLPPLIWTLPRTGRYWISAGGGYCLDMNIAIHLRTFTPFPVQPARDHRDVMLVTSADGGATWSAQRRVNDAPPRFDECFPSVAVDDLGQVHVAWYDRRDDPDCGTQVETYWAVSRDGGGSFYPSRRLSSHASDWSCAGAGPNFGDHLAVRAAGSRVYVLWTQANCPDSVDIRGVRIAGDDPTGIAVSEFRADAGGDRVRLTWRVDDGRGITGFRVERATGANGSFAPLNADLVPLDGRAEYVVEDPSAERGGHYRYRLAVLYADGSIQYIGPVEIELGVNPSRLGWVRATPSPFSERAQLTLAVPRAGEVEVEVYDLMGHGVATLTRDAGAPGPMVLSWDGRDRAGRPTAPGIYLLRARLGKEVALLRIVQLR